MIDDDEMLLRLFGAKLSAEGFNVIYARNGNEGREIARRMHPDLILLDIRMPDVDGFTIAHRLHTDAITKDIPVLFLTNEDFSPEAEKYAKESIVADYVHKSIDLDELVEKIKKHLSQ